MNNQLHIAKLNFKTALHISKGTNTLTTSDTTIHSDTIKSALFAIGVRYGSEMPDKAFLDSFTVSSAFPYFGDELFFPKPMSMSLDDFKIFGKKGEKEEQPYKIFKNIQYLGKSYFEKALRNTNLDVYSNNFLDAKKRFITEQFQTTLQKNKLTLSKKELQQRVNVKQENTFYIDKIHFPKESGLYFIIQFHDEKYKAIIQQYLMILGEEGIGKHKNVGSGSFDFEGFEPFSLDIPSDTEHFISLSLYCPETEEDLPKLDESAYEIIKRGGWIATPSDETHQSLRKRSVYMFKEGGVFRFSNKTSVMVKGQLHDLKPVKRPDVAHSIWRDGRGLFIGLKR